MVFLLAACALTVALLAIDLVWMRGAEVFDEPRTGDRETPPGFLHSARWVGMLFGILNFPGTVAPVILWVLAFQANPILTPGYISLVGVIYAGISMSAAIKCSRVAKLLVTLGEDADWILKRSAIYLGLFLLSLICIAIAGSGAEGKVALLVWSYLSIAIPALAIVAYAAHTALETTSKSETATAA